MSRVFLPLCLLASLAAAMLLPQAASASHQVTKTYTLTWPQGDVIRGSISGVGGASFSVADQAGQVPTNVLVTSASGEAISFTICQDFNGSLCGGAGEPRSEGCGEAEVSSTVPFDPARSTTVFVFNETGVLGSGCLSVVPSPGSITVTFG